MENHIRDYIYLSGILPEMSIWNQIVLYMDPLTMDTFFRTFPVIKLLDDYSQSPDYIGIFTVNGEIWANVYPNCDYKFYEEEILVYQVRETDKPLHSIITKSHFLISYNDIYLVTNDGIIGPVEYFFNDDSVFSPVLFINLIKKYRQIDHYFYMNFHGIYNRVQDKTGKKITEKEFVEFIEPIVGLPTGYSTCDVFDHVSEMVNRRFSV